MKPASARSQAKWQSPLAICAAKSGCAWTDLQARSAFDPAVTGLLDMGAQVRAHDPAGTEQARKELPSIEYCDDPCVCASGADVLAIATE